jgi:hypothetical protein
MTLFTPAARTQAKLRLAIDGPSGSGKTYSALLIAKGLAGGDLSKVALIDTERGSGSLYSDLGPYSVLGFEPPYGVKRFVTAHNAAVDEGFEVIVIDSLTHFWSGEGGVLDEVDKIAKASKSGNTFAAWKQGSPLQKTLMDTMLASPCHIVATIRSKTEWVLEQNDKGRTVPRKVGLAPDQRKDVDYEFTIVLDLSREHIATASKDRTGLFDERLEIPSEKMGAELLAWLGSAAPAPKKKPTKAAIDEQREQFAAGNGDAKKLPAAAQKRLAELIESRGRLVEPVLAAAARKGIGGGRLDTLTMDEAKKIAEAMKQLEEVPPDFGDKAEEPPDDPPDEPSSAPEPELSADDFAETPTTPQEAATAAPAAQAGSDPDDADFAVFDAELTKAAEEKAKAAAERLTQPVVTAAQMKRLHATATEVGVDHAELSKYARVMFGVASMKELRRTEAVLLLQFLRGEQKAQEMPVAS